MGRAKRTSVVDNAIYVDGRRTDNPASLEDTYELLRERKGMAWMGLYRPTRDDIMSLAAEFDLHPLAVDDAIAAHQRPKLERYGALLFTVLARLDTSTSRRRWSSVNCTSFSVPTTSSRSGTPSHLIWHACAADWSRTPHCFASVPRLFSICDLRPGGR